MELIIPHYKILEFLSLLKRSVVNQESSPSVNFSGFVFFFYLQIAVGGSRERII